MEAHPGGAAGSRPPDADVVEQSGVVEGPEAKAAVPALINALKDKDRSIHVFAAEALKKIPTPEALKALEELKHKSN